MSCFQGLFPQEVLSLIFQYVEPIDLLACIFVCREWHDSAKHQMYKELEFSKNSVIDRFIACVQSNHNPPKLHIEKITFTGNNLPGYSYIEDGDEDSDKEYGRNTFERNRFVGHRFVRNRPVRNRFVRGGFNRDAIARAREYDNYRGDFTSKVIQLLELCPHVQTLAASEQQMKAYIVQALLGLGYRLGNLTSFPYTRIFEYNECADLYRDMLKEFGVCLFEGKGTHFDLGELKNFPCLQKLHLIDPSLLSIQDVEIILSTCRQLEDLSIDLYTADSNNGLLQRNTALQLRRLQGHSQLQQRYPKMKRLILRTHAK
jgi:hypothetical protein